MKLFLLVPNDVSSGKLFLLAHFLCGKGVSVNSKEKVWMGVKCEMLTKGVNGGISEQKNLMSPMKCKQKGVNGRLSEYTSSLASSQP